MKAPPSVEALPTEVDPTTPHVVVALPPSDPPEAFSSDAPPEVTQADAATAVDVVVARLPPLGPLDPIDALETLEKVSVPPAPETIEAAPRAAEAPSALEPKTRPATLVFGSARANDVSETALDTQRSVLPPPADEPDTNERSDKATVRIAEEATASAIDPDEISVPPIGDVAVEEFFSEGDVARRAAADAVEGDDALTVTDTAKRKSEPWVVERRARFARYVKWAVAGAAVVCLAAVARTTVLSKAAAPAPASRMAIGIENESPAAAPKAAVAAAAPVGDPTGATAIASALPSDAPTSPGAAPVAEPTIAATDEVTGDAKEEKTKARSFLEKRKIAEAIEAGERSVKLDSSDGEAWLILGAAYQEKGNIVEARRAYAACVTDGKTGPRQECAKMLR